MALSLPDSRANPCGFQALHAAPDPGWPPMQYTSCLLTTDLYSRQTPPLLLSAAKPFVPGGSLSCKTRPTTFCPQPLSCPAKQCAFATTPRHTRIPDKPLPRKKFPIAAVSPFSRSPAGSVRSFRQNSASHSPVPLYRTSETNVTLPPVLPSLAKSPLSSVAR